MIDRAPLRLSAGLLLGGFVTYVVVTLLHAGGPANDHPVIFDEYAGSHDWGYVHLGQFVAMAAIVAGLLVLSLALDVRARGAFWTARLGAVAAALALGLYAVLQAVDGIALKRAVDAWAGAPAADKAVRFANAETVRWLEWGTHSYHSFLLGLALALTGSALALAARLPRALGILMGMTGVAYFVQGWALASNGFSATNSSAILAGYVLMLAWTTWLAVLAWGRRGGVTQPSALVGPAGPTPAAR